MLALMLYVPFNIFSITTSVFLLSSLVDPVLSRLYKSVLLKRSTQCPDESRTSDPRSPFCKWKIKKILIKCRTDWKNYRHTRSGYIPRPPGRVAQSVTCLATDACLTADPGVASSIPARSHTFVEIDHEIISTVILLPSADSFKKGSCQLQAKVCAQITG